MSKKYNILESLQYIREAKDPNQVVMTCSGGVNIKFSKKKFNLEGNDFAYMIEQVARDILAWKKLITLDVYNAGNPDTAKYLTEKMKSKIKECLEKATYMNTETTLSKEDVVGVGSLIKVFIAGIGIGAVV